MPNYYLAPHGDVHTARQIIEMVSDFEFCGEGRKDPHTLCMLTTRAASWPEPSPLHDLDDPDWTGT